MKEEKASNSCRKNLKDNEMESVSGGFDIDSLKLDGSELLFSKKIGQPIYEQCSKCGGRIITGYYGKNTAPPRHFCGRIEFRNKL